MKKVVLSLLIATAVSANFAYSQDKQPATAEKSGDIVAPSREMQTIILAGQLAKYGYENNSATALIEAAELYLSVPTQEFKPESAELGKGEETTKTEFVSHDPKKILADAKELADGDANLLALIEKLEKAKPSRGLLGGPAYGEYKLPARSEHTFTFLCNGSTTFVVSGDGDTDLDLYVYYAPTGKLIAKDDDYSDDCVVSINCVNAVDKLYVKVVNRGNVYNRYVIATN